MCLSWNIVSFPPPIDQRPLEELIDDVTWVFTCLNTPEENDDTTTTATTTRRKSRTSAKRSAPTAKNSAKRICI